jgi:dCMP deaminase
MIKPHKEKYHKLYQDLAERVSQESVAISRQVGAVIVAQSGMMSIGWNGTPSGFDNNCEYDDQRTKPEVIHAERNAIDKMTRQGVSTQGAILFTTTAPCIECAKSIAPVGISQVYYRDHFTNNDGIDFLHISEVSVLHYG